MKRPISIIYTGGTLGMRQAGGTYVPAPNLAELIESRLPELQSDEMPEYVLTEYANPIESANVTPKDWYELAEKIYQTRDDYDGFVVIHGTDTLAYTASSLSFLLGGLDKPVVVTGSQIPLCEVRNDAQSNLLGAVQAIASGKLNEVAVCFGRRILRGNRVSKVSAKDLDAFDSPNFPQLAEVATDIRFSDFGALPAPHPSIDTGPPTYRDVNLAVLRLYPGMPAGFIDAMVNTGAAGLVLRCYGVGTGPAADAAFLGALRRAGDSGMLVVAVSQCAEGSVALRRYEAGSLLADAGVVSGYDMTTEAAFAKLHMLLARGLTGGEAAELMQSNLRGELTVH